MYGDAHAVGKFLYFDWEDPNTICPAIELTNPYETLPLALQFEESSPLSLLSVHSSLFFQRPSLKQATQLSLSRYFPVLRVRVYPLLCKPSGNVWTTDCLGQKGIFSPYQDAVAQNRPQANTFTSTFFLSSSLATLCCALGRYIPAPPKFLRGSFPTWVVFPRLIPHRRS